MPEAMVEGEPITKDEATAPIDAIRLLATSSTTTTGKPGGALIGALRTGTATGVADVSRLPPPPPPSSKYHLRVIVLPGGGLDMPPMLMGVRLIKDTTTIILLFDGLEVRNYVRCSMHLLRCTVYKRQIDICYNCGLVGHRQDVCPTPSEKVCEHYVIKPTRHHHVCVTPKRRCNNNQQTEGVSAKQQPTPKRPALSQPMKHLPTITKGPTATPTLGPTESPAKIDGISHAFYAHNITVWCTSGRDGHIEERLQEALGPALSDIVASSNYPQTTLAEEA
ncbi:hypothetical protein MTO96_038943 [Rhipicephalus appendiculatus]